MKIAIISLGCPKNQVDADVFCHALIKDGHTTTPELSEADCIIINTCGFIESAKTPLSPAFPAMRRSTASATSPKPICLWAARGSSARRAITPT